MNEQLVPDDIIDVDAGAPSEDEESEDDVTPFVCESILHEEISLEEALLQRLKETINKRLEWALKLQNLIQNGSSNGVKVEETEHAIQQTSFSDAAKGAYEAISSTSILTSVPEYTRLANFVPHPDSIAHQLALVRQYAPPTPQLPTPISNGYALPPRTRHTTRVAPPQTNQYLYILDTLSTPSLLYKLTCPHPSCQRSDFPRLQGLLNHCRIKHGQEYGSHDECIQACAILVETEEERAKVIREGLEITGMSASLKRLFEMAVGRGVAVVTGNASSAVIEQQKEDGVAPMDLDNAAPLTDSTNSASTLLSQTLGIHADTPALAPFLRTSQRKRCINVHDENAIVDIGAQDLPSTANASNSALQPWRKIHQQRSRSDSSPETDDIIALSYELDASSLADVVGLEAKDDKQQQVGTGKLVDTSASSTHSRFHVTARLGISDWSMRIADDLSQGLTHRWMILVQAPAYSIHASTFIASLTLVTSSPATFLNVPSPTVNVTTPQTASPPFIIAGTANVPFGAALAIELVGSGPKKNRTVRVEQWVDIEAGRSDRPQLGDEQLLDVELDRNVPLLPRRGDESFFANASSSTDPAPSTSSAQNDWCADFYANVLGIKKPQPGDRMGGDTTGRNKDGGDYGPGALKGDGQSGKGKGKKRGAGGSEPAYVAQLRALLPRFPMTLRDAVVKSRPTAQLQVPYLLPMSPAHFNAMVLGRRKSIEWGRARALHDAYCAILSASNSSSARVQNTQFMNAIPTNSTALDSTALPITADGTAPVAVKTEPGTTSNEQAQLQNPPLSICDIYRWLESEGHFIRTPKSKSQSTETTKAKDCDKAGKVKIKVKLKGKSLDPGQSETVMGGMAMENAAAASGETNAAGSNSSKSKAREIEYCPLCGVNLRAIGATAAAASLGRISGKADGGSASAHAGTGQEVQPMDALMSPLSTHLCPMRTASGPINSIMTSDADFATLKPPLLDFAAISQRCASERIREAREGAVAAMTVSSREYGAHAHAERLNERTGNRNNDVLNPDQSDMHKSEHTEAQAQSGRTVEMQSAMDLDTAGYGPSRGLTNGYGKGSRKSAGDQERHFINGEMSALVACTDPALVRAIRQIVVNLSEARNQMQSQKWSPRDGGGPNGEVVSLPKEARSRPPSVSRLHEVESVEDIAPYALLTQVTRVYLRRLVTDGVNVLNTSSRYLLGNDQPQLQPQGPPASSSQLQGPHVRARVTGPARTSSQPTPGRLLTPAHIYRGLEERARRTEGLDSVLLSVARLGEWVDEMEASHAQ